MIQWSEQHEMIRDAVRRFVEAEIVPNLEELEHGDTPPYEVLRKLISTFGMDEMARARFQKMVEQEKAGGGPQQKAGKARESGRGDAVALQLIPIAVLQLRRQGTPRPPAA